MALNTINEKAYREFYNDALHSQRAFAVFVDLDGYPSFQALHLLCAMATASGLKMRAVIISGSLEIEADPGDHPHDLYKKYLGDAA